MFYCSYPILPSLRLAIQSETSFFVNVNHFWGFFIYILTKCIMSLNILSLFSVLGEFKFYGEGGIN